MQDYFLDASVLFFQYFSPWIGAIILMYLLVTIVIKGIEKNAPETEDVESLLKTLTDLRSNWKILVVLALVVATYHTLTSSRLQFKMDPVDSEHVLQQQQRQIQEQYEETRDQPIVDRTRQPSKTEDERKSDFDDMVDWKNRE